MQQYKPPLLVDCCFGSRGPLRVRCSNTIIIVLGMRAASTSVRFRLIVASILRWGASASG
eukprot:scaffold9730_cov48-Cyclotella_meneghiniana.AAC.1